MERKHAWILSFFASLLVVFAFYGCSSHSNGHDNFYRTMTINPHSFQVSFSDPIPDHSETSGPFFWPFTISTGDYEVSSYDGKHPYPNRVRYNDFTISQDNRLEDRTKYQELLNGPFGTVDAETNFYYSNGKSSSKIVGSCVISAPGR